MNKEIIFSIIIPTYNRAHLILNTLDSIRYQSFTEYEVIIVDDGSVDHTETVVREYLEKHRLPDWYYYYKNNGERGAARNFGVNKAKGKFVTFLDSDDLFYENHLEQAFKFIDKHPSVKVFHSSYEIKNCALHATKKVRYPKTMTLNKAILKGNVLSCFGMFIDRNTAVAIPFEEDRKLSGSEDWLLWLRLSARFPVYFQNIVTGCLVEHNERSVLNFSSEQLMFRANLLFNILKTDKIFLAKNGVKCINGIYAHMLTYGALHLALSGKKMESLKMLIAGIKVKYSELLTKRFFVTLLLYINFKKI
jgi:glycosyltransferase involved in cell wall biosynthesis